MNFDKSLFPGVVTTIDVKQRLEKCYGKSSPVSSTPSTSLPNFVLTQMMHPVQEGNKRQ